MRKKTGYVVNIYNLYKKGGGGADVETLKGLFMDEGLDIDNEQDVKTFFNKWKRELKALNRVKALWLTMVKPKT